MSIGSVSASNQINLAAVFAPAQGSPRHAEHGDRDSSGGGNSEGITVLASLLEALVQAATPSAASANAAATASTTGTAAVGTSTPAPTTGAATGTTGTTGTTSTTTGATSTTTGTTSTTTGTTSPTNLVADLQAFLHDLFSALRQAGRSGHGGREHELWRERAETSNIPAPSTSAPASGTTTPASSTSAPASSATPVVPATTSGTVTATTSSPAAGSTTPVAVTNPAIGAYGPRNIISELKALVQELSSGQASSSTGSVGGVSQNLLSNLNSAFEKLISDLKGTASAAGTTSTAGTTAAGTAAAATAAAGTSTSGTAAASASTTAPSPTAALQAFLTNFAQDLQNNGAHSLNPVGSSVNTTA
jgi:hypothetical protein